MYRYFYELLQECNSQKEGLAVLRPLNKQQLIALAEEYDIIIDDTRNRHDIANQIVLIEVLFPMLDEIFNIE